MIKLSDYVITEQTMRWQSVNFHITVWNEFKQTIQFYENIYTN